MKTYSELIKLESFVERFNYAKLWDQSHESPRRISNPFYKSREWRDFRKAMIQRDMGFDLGCNEVSINGPILLHHLNPITETDILLHRDCLLDPENVICVSYDTHNKIHYQTDEPLEYVERTPGDTKLW